jgi:predicted amidophosphoribosyltransferase
MESANLNATVRAGDTFMLLGLLRTHMGNRPCDRAFCPTCDLQVTVVDETCPDCGSELPGEPH